MLYNEIAERHIIMFKPSLHKLKKQPYRYCTPS
jgi:hypothetical protein